MSIIMYNEPKSATFVAATAHLLRHGFGLQPTDRSDESLEELVKPLLASLDAQCTSLESGEQCCGQLLAGGKVACFKMCDSKDDVAHIKATVPRQALTFFGTSIASITIFEYLTHIVPKIHCSEEALIMAIVYIARAVQKGVPFTPRSAHRMLAAAILVALKTHDERQYPMSYYAKITGIPQDKLSKAESALLFVLDFTTLVLPAEYTLMMFSLRSCHAQCTDKVKFGTWSSVVERVSIPGKAAPLYQPHKEAVRGSFRSLRSMRDKRASSAYDDEGSTMTGTEGLPLTSTDDTATHHECASPVDF